jgi:hypothetical protein
MPSIRTPIRVFLLSLVAFSPRAFAGQWTITDAQFHSSTINLTSIDSQGVHIADSQIPWENVLELSHAARLNTPESNATARFELRLLNGDRLRGAASSMADEKLSWQSPVLGAMQWPMDQLQSIVRAGAAVSDLDQHRTDDVVRLANGDSTHGIVTQIGPAGVTLQTDSASPVLPWDSISAVLFSSPPSPSTQPGQARKFRVRFGRGEVLTVANFSLGDGKLKIPLDLNTFCQIDESNVATIEQVDGPVSWLTSRTPAQNIYKPFFSEQFPTRFDRGVDDDRPIREKFPGFHHGIGCHSYSRLVYALDGSYDSFRAQFAIDSDSPLADVTVRVLLNNVVVFEQKNVKAGPISPVIYVSLVSAKTLALEVDYGDNYAAEDRFVWLDPALVRAAAPSTQPAASAANP